MDTAAAQVIPNRLINVAAYDMSAELIADARTALSYLVERAPATPR